MQRTRGLREQTASVRDDLTISRDATVAKEID